MLVHPLRNILVVGLAIWDFRYPPPVIRERRCNLAQNTICQISQTMARRKTDVKTGKVQEYTQY